MGEADPASHQFSEFPVKPIGEFSVILGGPQSLWGGTVSTRQHGIVMDHKPLDRLEATVRILSHRALSLAL